MTRKPAAGSVEGMIPWYAFFISGGSFLAIMAWYFPTDFRDLSPVGEVVARIVAAGVLAAGVWAARGGVKRLVLASLGASSILAALWFVHDVVVFPTAPGSPLVMAEPLKRLALLVAMYGLGCLIAYNATSYGARVRRRRVEADAKGSTASFGDAESTRGD